jgi:hypothetical protein
MISALVLSLSLLAEPVPGDALRLAPDPSVGSGPAPTIAAPVVPATTGFSMSEALAALTTGIVALAAGILAHRREEEAAGTLYSGEPLVVFVSGHGSSPAPGVFAHLTRMMGLDPEQARYFDYRWAAGGASHVGASQDATVDDAADALAGYLAGLSSLGRPVYLVGHSKGGASIAELIARWDRGQPGSAAVQGASLLDPPMAAGIHGWLQSLGTRWGPLADDGGYDPVACSLLRGCEDDRDQLGRASGVEVMVVRNPVSGMANFGDAPAGLRVYDAADGGPGFWETLFTRPWAIFSRISEAHNSVLHDQRVADCIVAEMRRPGSCSLPRATQDSRVPSWLGGWQQESPTAGASTRTPSMV